ncbi:MAG: fimbrillin family protein [Dysgonamonadaceae bacterium]|jgi:hypothetical protein|nr:fimbrillin family protein [Dysgonamonadaceae bacterium]
MKMKSLFLGLSLLAIAGMWTGCSNDDEVNSASNEKQAISFRVQGGVPALRATGTTLPFVNAFVVNAYGDVTGAAGATLDAITVYRVEGTDANNFTYSPKAYFSANDTEVDFAAYSPVSTSITSGLGVSGITNEITYTVNAPNPSGNTAQEDLLVAFTNQTDLTATTVPLNFKHALSRVYVTAVNTTNADAIITSLRLVNLYGRGTLAINNLIENVYANPAADFSDYVKLWVPAAPQNNAYAYVLPQSGVSVASGTTAATLVVSQEQGMLVLPQTTLNDPAEAVNIANPAFGGAISSFYVEVGYRLANAMEIIRIPFEDVNAITPTAANEGLTFEFGRQYALNINFAQQGNLVEINFSVTVEPWNVPAVIVP